jgi:hypothetical protein
MERQTIENVLRQTDGNKSKAARRLGLTPTQMYVRLAGTAWSMLRRCDGPALLSEPGRLPVLRK